MKRMFLCSEFYVVANHIFKNYLKDKSLKVLFISTASETIPGERNWVKNDRQAFINSGFDLMDFTVTNKTKDDVEKAFEKANAIYSTGGDVFHYLRQIKKSNSVDSYRKAILKENKIYIGGSAGSMIASPDISPRNYPGSKHDATNLDNFKALGLVDFFIIPHWSRDDTKERHAKLQMPYITTLDTHKVILLTDNQYVKVEGDMYKIIDQRTDYD